MADTLDMTQDNDYSFTENGLTQSSLPNKSNPYEAMQHLNVLSEMASSPFNKNKRAAALQSLEYFKSLHEKVLFYETNAGAWEAVVKGGEVVPLHKIVEQSRAEYEALRQKSYELTEQYRQHCLGIQNAAHAAIQNMESHRQALLAEEDYLRHRLRSLESGISEAKERAELEEVGLYEYDHPAEQVIRFKDRLDRINEDKKDMVKTHRAIKGSGGSFTFNNSAAEGKKFMKDFGALLLAAYNQEVENAIYRLEKTRNEEAAVNRIVKAYERVEKLGSMMSMSIAERYHKLRLEEVHIAFEYKNALAQKKIQEAEERAALREQEKAEREAQAEIDRLAKEQRELERQLEAERQRLLAREREHYANAINKLEEGAANGTAPEPDIEESETMKALRARLAELEGSKVKVQNHLANTKAGYVYVISNIGSFGEEVVKIGLTRRLNPLDRVKELGDASVPFRFDVHAIHFSNDAVTLENALHKRFAHKAVNKVNHRKEFFRVTPLEVRDAMMELSNGALLEFTEEPEAEEFRQSLIMSGGANSDEA